MWQVWQAWHVTACDMRQFTKYIFKTCLLDTKLTISIRYSATRCDLWFILRLLVLQSCAWLFRFRQMPNVQCSSRRFIFISYSNVDVSVQNGPAHEHERDGRTLVRFQSVFGGGVVDRKKLTDTEWIGKYKKRTRQEASGGSLEGQEEIKTHFLYENVGVCVWDASPMDWNFQLSNGENHSVFLDIFAAAFAIVWMKSQSLRWFCVCELRRWMNEWIWLNDLQFVYIK